MLNDGNFVPSVSIFFICTPLYTTYGVQTGSPPVNFAWYVEVLPTFS